MPVANSDSSKPGWYLVPTPHGFRLHLCVSDAAIATVRRHVRCALRDLAQPDTIDTAQLLMTELLTNALSACGTHTPVVVVVHVGTGYVDLDVYDPDADNVPSTDTAMPDLNRPGFDGDIKDPEGCRHGCSP
jgi:hypothetical protein